jgi:hypothetical protein
MVERPIVVLGGDDTETWLRELLADLAQDDTRTRKEKVAGIRAATESAYPAMPVDEALLAVLVRDLIDTPVAVPSQDPAAYGILKRLVQ